MKKIVIACDSFKGSLGSREVAGAAAAGVREVCGDGCEVVKVAVADGGEGLLEALAMVFGERQGESDEREAEEIGGGNADFQTITTVVRDPLGRRILAEYLIYKGTAVIEMARASGLPLLKAEERDPMKTSSYGTGEMIMDAFRRGCRKFLIGLGGSATNDGGTGMLEALGFRFYDHEGRLMNGTTGPDRFSGDGLCGGRLAEIAAVDAGTVDDELLNSWFEVACDVETPFCGEAGAARVFARQKGADEAMVEALEAGMQAWAGVAERWSGKAGGGGCGMALREMAGAGAAGGLGGALAVFMNAKLRKGIEIVLDAIGFDGMIRGADLVITGEGRIDEQTFMGKVPSGVLARAQRQGIPVIAIGGLVDLSEESAEANGFHAILPIQPKPRTAEELQAAMNPDTTASNIRQTVIDYLKTKISEPKREPPYQTKPSLSTH